MFLKDIERIIKKAIPVVKEHAFDNKLMHDAPVAASQQSISGNFRGYGNGRKSRRTFTQRA
jgi:hypothetical protein